MTQEDKELLLNDLCARLPYGVKVAYLATTYNIQYVDSKFDEVKLDGMPHTVCTGYIKPYLRPMSSMTEEEKEEWDSYVSVPPGKSLRRTPYCIKYMEWLLEHHFDFRHLIEKGLALEAPEDMYKTE